MVGAAGSGTNGSSDFKDLRGTQRYTKSLNRNDRKRAGIDIAPLKPPHFFRIPQIPPQELRMFSATIQFQCD
jgi:hypothetical protein